jgi:flavin-dependent dehydrogenase
LALFAAKMPSPVDTPVLIVGAGISGLILAQVFRKERIPFRIVERKENAEAGGAGWGFTINWSLSLLLEMLPPQLQDRFSDTYVDQEAVKRGELATFPFFDLLSGEMKYEVPSSKRVRVNRDKLRKLLLSEIDVEESGTLSTVIVTH